MQKQIGMKKLVVLLLVLTITTLFLVGCTSNINGTYVFSKMEGEMDGLRFSVTVGDLNSSDEMDELVSLFKAMKIIIEGDDLTFEMDGETDTTKFTREGKDIIIEQEGENILEAMGGKLSIKGGELIMEINIDGIEASITFVKK
ncbi:MAG: hypothetical protein WC292_00550 [Clostridia bacterium]